MISECIKSERNMNKEEAVEKKIYLPDSITIKMSELLYLCFWGIMLFIKGIGLYDGQISYKICLIIAFLCIAAKICITEYSGKEWCIILFLLILSTIVYRVSGEKGVLICMVTVVAMKNVSVKRAFQTGLIVWSTAMGGRFLVSLINIDSVETAVQTKNFSGAVLRYFMGYPHPNVLHISYLVLAAFVIYCVKNRYHWKHLLILMLGNLFIFFYSYSYTGALIVMLYVCLSYYVSNKKINQMEYFLVKLFFPFCILFSIIFPLALKGKAFELADKVFNNRINFARHFLTIDNMSLVGNNLAAITTDILTMDNAYVFALVTYGILIFLLICAGYMITVSDYVKQKKNMELAMICCFLFAGITEPFLFNTSFKNLTLLFVGEEFFERLNKGTAEQRMISLLKHTDKDMVIPMKRLQKCGNELCNLWYTHKKIILRVGIIAALLISLFAGIFYQARPAAVEVQKENLLIFDRIRVILTAFCLGFACTCMMSSIGYKVRDHKKMV